MTWDDGRTARLGVSGDAEHPLVINFQSLRRDTPHGNQGAQYTNSSDFSFQSLRRDTPHGNVFREESLTLPDNWREIIRRQMLAEAQKEGQIEESMEREKERLKLKKVRTIKLYKEGYIEDAEFQGEMTAVELAIRKLDIPEVDGVTYDEVIEAGEHIPGMAALWDVATPEERREMVILMLEPGGLYYDMEQKIIAALKPRPAFLLILRMLNGIVEYDEARGLLLVERWQDRNRRASDYLQAYLRDRQTQWANIVLMTSLLPLPIVVGILDAYSRRASAQASCTAS